VATLFSIFGFLALFFGLRWLLAAARWGSLVAGRRRGRRRGHFLGRDDRRFGDAVVAAVAIVGAVVVARGGAGWVPWLAAAVAGPSAMLVGWGLEAHRARRFEGEAMAVLEALRGLLRSGALSPPAALARIGASGDGAGARRLRTRLAALDDGESFDGTLRRFARKLDGKPVAEAFLAVADASRAGLPVLPMLDRALPELRARALAEEKLRAVRSRTVAQAVVAALVPWCLAALMAASSPEPWPSDGRVTAARLLALSLEIAGIAVAWRLTCFR
jgi:Flp pilus assembly protein TadB